jgi:MFS family permease
MAWRLPFIIQALFATLLAIIIFTFIPFSPRWLVQQDREELALHVLRQLRLPRRSHIPSQEYEVQEMLLRHELDDIKLVVQESRRLALSNASYAELFNKRYRHRSYLGLAIMTFQQLSGIDVILYFAPVVFASVFTTQTASFLASGGTGIVLVLSTIPAQIWVDKWGRKPPMVFGGAAMAACFLIIGSLFARYGIKNGDQVTLTGGPAKYVVVALIYLFVGLFSVTWAVVSAICELEGG